MDFSFFGGLSCRYESKLKELERERQHLMDEKAQVAGYQQLLAKQRDIMVALTSKLHERDEAILRMQEELDKCASRLAPRPPSLTPMWSERKRRALSLLSSHSGTNKPPSDQVWLA